MDHNPRVIETAALPPAVRDRLKVEAPEAIRLESLRDEQAGRLRDHAGSLGIAIVDGERGARYLVAGEPALLRLGEALESGGERSLGSSIRATLQAYRRDGFAIPFADGVVMDLVSETRVMGILNVTPDSFSDGGRIAGPEAAVEAAARMVEAGVDIVDVGGESTRPGAFPVDETEETGRAIPAVRAIKRALRVRVSIDTSKAAVARRALDAGADLVNDISALADDGMLRVLQDSRAPAVVMHRRGTPSTMQQNTAYEDLLSTIVGFLRETVERALAAGIPDDRILVDPGLGFGKSAAGNLQILRELETIRSVGRAIVVGASRKSFIGAVLGLPVDDRLEGGLAVAGLAAWKGAHMIRTHDVRATKRITRMVDAVRRG